MTDYMQKICDSGNFSMFNHPVNSGPSFPLTNITCNSTQTDIQSGQNSALYTFILVSYLSTFIFGLSGNTLVIYIIGYFSRVREKSVANYYIWNLAFADELLILALPLFCWATYSGSWPIPGQAGDIACKLSYIARDISRFTSVLTLCALSVDRALASCHYLGYMRTITVGKIICVSIWACSFIISTPYFIFAQTVETKNGRSCRLHWHGSPQYRHMIMWATFHLFVGLIVPSVFILGSYVILFKRLKRMKQRTGSMSMKRPNKKMTQTVIAIIVTFIICQLPYHYAQFSAANWNRIYEEKGEDFKAPKNEVLRHVWLNTISQVLVFISSCCNPIIYGLLNENFRRLYKVVLCRCHSKDCSPPADLNLDMDEPYTPAKFKFQVTFHLPSVGFKKLRQYQKEKTQNQLTERIEMFEGENETQNLNTATTIVNE